MNNDEYNDNITVDTLHKPWQTWADEQAKRAEALAKQMEDQAALERQVMGDMTKASPPASAPTDLELMMLCKSLVMVSPHALMMAIPERVLREAKMREEYQPGTSPSPVQRILQSWVTNLNAELDRRGYVRITASDGGYAWARK